MTTTEPTLVPTMDELFVDPRSLPSPSVSVLEIIRRADDPDVSMSDIAKLVEGDVSIAVQVLRMANSALYAPSQEITTISRALSSLGLRTVKLLALTTSLRALIPQQSDAVDLSDIRHRMVVTASVARRSAQLLDPAWRDEAFVAGLLTGIGPVVLASEAPTAARAILGDRQVWPGPDVERSILGYTTDDVTAELVMRWGLPTLFADAVRRRHGGSGTAAAGDLEEFSGVGGALRLATLAEPVLTGRDSGSNLEALRVLMPTVAEIEVEEVDDWLIDTESVVADTAAMLQFRVPQEIAYAQLLAEASERLVSLQFSLENQLFKAEESAGDLVKRNDQLETEASTDALTKLPNRRAFDRRLASLLETPAEGLGLLMLDLDHFKAVNDTHGHAVGDDVLRVVGATLQSQTRGDDFAARFGGEEFVMLIPSTSNDRLLVIAERLRVSIAELIVPLQDGSTVSVTTSIGGAMISGSPDVTSDRALIEAADEQLYAAKQSGRNRTCLA